MIAVIILKIYYKKDYEKFIIIFLTFWYIHECLYNSNLF